jgi:2-polyprenyl-3-methyl-5-hydroxy-6-metoxy-1,4-benzoquinol methylase
MTEDKSASWAVYYEKLRDRPPRRTLLAALDRFGAPPPGALVIDLGCGDGRDVVEMLRRGWRVVAVDAEREALRQLQATSRRSWRDWKRCRCRSASAW